jgi:putative hemolysin
MADEEQIGEAAQAISFGGHDYVIVQSGGTRNDASSYCQSIGYQLATIDDDNEIRGFRES